MILNHGSVGEYSRMRWVGPMRPFDHCSGCTVFYVHRSNIDKLNVDDKSCIGLMQMSDFVIDPYHNKIIKARRSLIDILEDYLLKYQLHNL